MEEMPKMVNLLAETEAELEYYGLTWEDVKFVAASGCYFTNMERVRKMMDFDYKYNSEHIEVDLTLLIVGEDWYLERWRGGDGFGEWWEMNSIPCMPKKHNSRYPRSKFRPKVVFG